MALFSQKGLLKLVYPFDGSTDYVNKTDVLGISTSVETVSDGYALSVETVLTGNTHMTVYGEVFTDYDAAVAFCTEFCKDLDDALTADVAGDVTLMLARAGKETNGGDS